MVEFVDPDPLTHDDEGEEKREEALLDTAFTLVRVQIPPKRKKFPANKGDNDIYPQLSEKCATNNIT